MGILSVTNPSFERTCGLVVYPTDDAYINDPDALGARYGDQFAELADEASKQGLFAGTHIFLMSKAIQGTEDTIPRRKPGIIVQTPGYDTAEYNVHLPINESKTGELALQQVGFSYAELGFEFLNRKPRSKIPLEKRAIAVAILSKIHGVRV